MATVKSTQVTALDTSLTKLRASELYGRVRVAYFDYTTPASSAPGIGDILQAVKLPKGVRILAISLAWEALSSAGGTAGATIGTTDDPNRFITAKDMDAAGVLHMLPVIDQLPDSVLTVAEPTYLILTVTGEAWAVSKKIQGYVLFVQD
tara:strand:- start:215 stop:661 length:447 start_codon:yes stop_codon:yes gene_type:complete